MATICHLFDGTSGWEERVAAKQLMERLPADRYSALVATIDSSALPLLSSFKNQVSVLARRPVGGTIGDVLAAGSVARFVSRNRIDVVFAWGRSAARAAWMARRVVRNRCRSVVLELFDPAAAAAEGKFLRLATSVGGLALVSTSQTIQRRLYENGVGPEFCTVIRPAVDFAALNRARRGGLREQLGIRADETAVLLPEPVRRRDHPFDAFWATVLLHHLGEGFRGVLPGCSREIDRLRRFAAALPTPAELITPGDGVRFEELIAMADVLLVPAAGDAPTAGIAWAMGAGAAIVAAAQHSVTELVVHRVNGLLFKQTPEKSSMMAIAALLRDRKSQLRLKEAARGQSYEVFGLRRFVDQHRRLLDNVLAGAAPGQGIADSAAISA